MFRLVSGPKTRARARARISAVSRTAASLLSASSFSRLCRRRARSSPPCARMASAPTSASRSSSTTVYSVVSGKWRRCAARRRVSSLCVWRSAATAGASNDDGNAS